MTDVEESCRERFIYMLGPGKARFLNGLVRERAPRFVVECGTAIGYSGLWIAAALRETGEGRLVTIEIDNGRAREAQKNFARAGLAEWVDPHSGDAAKVLEKLEIPVDFLFLDNDYGNYYRCFRAIESRLKNGATLVADNVGVGEYGMTDYLRLVRDGHESRTHWFETDLPWLGRDAMEVSRYRRPE